MLRVLLRRRWLGALAAACVFAVACFFLGRWQWSRFESRHHVNVVLNSHYHSTPVSLNSVLPTPNSTLTTDQEWTVITATGHYQPAKLLLVRNRPLNGNFGYEILVPFRLTNGEELLADRGWVSFANTAAERPKLPPVPSGEVAITGYLRFGEPNLDRGYIPGELESINIPQARQQTGLDLYNTYLQVRDETAFDGVVTHKGDSLPLADTEGTWGINLSYAFQWWLGIPAGFWLVYAGARREHYEELEATGQWTRPPKKKKVRIWDEEDE